MSLTLQERIEIISGLTALKVIADKVPEVAPYAGIVLEAAIDAVDSQHDDPLSVLEDSRDALKAKIADAMKAKFPNG